MKSFTEKTVRIALSLGLNQIGAQPGIPAPAKEIEGLACSVNVQKTGLPQKNTARINLWGLSRDSMRQFTSLAFRPLESYRNTVSIQAGTRGGALSLVFEGEVSLGYADFNQAPDPCMVLEADSSCYPAQQAEAVTTINGSVPAVRLFENFARQAGYAFSNQGVTTSVADVWLPGSPVDKMMKLATDIGVDLIIDDGQVIILPADQPRQGAPVLLSSQTGLIGYPTFTHEGIACRCLYNPSLKYAGLIRTESVVPGASGMWKITRLSHSLSVYMPGGAWETSLEASCYE